MTQRWDAWALESAILSGYLCTFALRFYTRAHTRCGPNLSRFDALSFRSSSYWWLNDYYLMTCTTPLYLHVLHLEVPNLQIMLYFSHYMLCFPPIVLVWWSWFTSAAWVWPQNYEDALVHRGHSSLPPPKLHESV